MRIFCCLLRLEGKVSLPLALLSRVLPLIVRLYFLQIAFLLFLFSFLRYDCCVSATVRERAFSLFFYFQRNLALGSGISRLSVLKDSGKQPLEHQCLSKEENNLFFVFYYARYVLPSFSKNIGQSI